MDPGPFTDPRVFGPRVPGYPGTRVPDICTISPWFSSGVDVGMLYVLRSIFCCSSVGEGLPAFLTSQGVYRMICLMQAIIFEGFFW